MRSGAALSLGVATFLAATSAAAEGLPTCRVRLVKPAEAVPRHALRQVESWASVPERGCRLVSSIDEADVLLEFHQYEATTLGGIPAEKWSFIARRLSEPVRERATQRFAYLTILDRRSKDHVARELPIVLSDVCLGYLPRR